MPYIRQDTTLIDRDSPIPAYQQIVRSLTNRIIDGEWQPNDKLPSENDLASEYAVSRITLRQALSILESDKIIRKEQGRGVFVQRNPDYVVHKLFFPTVNNNGKALRESEVHSKAIDISLTDDADNKIFKKLKIPASSELIFLQRLFTKGDKIIGLNRAWFPAEKVPNMQNLRLINNSVSTTLLQRYQIEAVRIENSIEAIKMDAVLAATVEVPYDSAGLKINSIHFDKENSPFEFASTVWVGELTKFQLTMTKDS